MIEILNGAHEIVDYHGNFKIRVYLNDEYEDYPQHWHSDIEIIMPLEDCYQVNIDEVTYNLDVEDILVIPPGQLHRLIAPPSGRRVILQFETALLNGLNDFKSAFHMFRPCVLVTPSEMPDTHKELVSLVRTITSEYFSTLSLL